MPWLPAMLPTGSAPRRLCISSLWEGLRVCEGFATDPLIPQHKRPKNTWSLHGLSQLSQMFSSGCTAAGAELGLELVSPFKQKQMKFGWLGVLMVAFQQDTYQFRSFQVYYAQRISSSQPPPHHRHPHCHHHRHCHLSWLLIIIFVARC